MNTTGTLENEFLTVGKKKSEEKQMVPDGTGRVGNTDINPPPRKRPSALKKYFMTWYRPDNGTIKLEDVTYWKRLLEPITDKWTFQVEQCPTTGNEHIQGGVWLNGRTRITGLKKLDERAHWEPMKDEIATFAYCTKKETRVRGPWSKGFNTSHYEGSDLPSESELKPWMKFLIDICNEKPHHRAIYWCWEPIGGVGKSDFAKYMVYHMGANVIGGASKDCLHMVTKASDKRIFIMDIARDKEDYVSYNALEQIKRGMIVSPKFDSCSMLFDRPHVIVFANFPPDTSKLSEDVWRVYGPEFFETVDSEPHDGPSPAASIPGGKPRA